MLAAPATATFTIQNTSQQVFEENDTLNFTYQTSELSNYTLNITHEGTELERLDLNLTENLSDENTTEYVISVSHDVKISPVGSRNVMLWKNYSVNSSELSGYNLTSVGNLSYRMAVDQPDIFRIDILPSIKFTNSTITADIGVTDSEEDVNISEFSIDGRTFEMRELFSTENLQEFRTNFTLNVSRNYDYTVEVEDSGGLTDSFSGDFFVETDPGSKDTNISVSTDSVCTNIISSLSAPGREPTNVITKNTTGSFLGEFINKGSLPHQMDVELDVTFEGNESWEQGEEPGPVIVSYASKNFTLDSSSNGEYFRQFTAVYDAGNYTGRMRVDSLCEDEEDNETVDLDFNVTDNFEIVNVEGEDSLLENGSQTTNQSIPADSSRRGAESDQTLEGDNPEPGTTAEPEPRPEPSLSINMETEKIEYITSKNRFQEVNLMIQNFHNESLQSVSLVPQIDDLEGDWETRTGSITSIAPGDNLNSSVFLQPSDNVPAGNYRIPVMARLASGRALDVEYINFRVTEEVFQPNMSISEVPRIVRMQRNSSRTVPVQIRNSGSQSLNNISIEVQNLEDCGSVSSNSIDSLKPGSTSSIQLDFQAGKTITECETLFVASSAEGAYSFANVRVEVNPAEGFIPSEFRVPLIASVWTIILVLYAVLSRRYELDSLTVKLPFLILILGESVIFLYLAANYYGLIPQGFLPF